MNTTLQHNEGLDAALPLAMHIATVLEEMTNCRIIFEALPTSSGHYMFEPSADETLILISTRPLIQGDFYIFYRTLFGLASYHLAIPPGDWRRLLPIQASYLGERLIAPYQEQLNLETVFTFLCGHLLHTAGTCPFELCYTSSSISIVQEEQPQPQEEPITLDCEHSRFWSVRQGHDLKPTISGDLYRLIS